MISKNVKLCDACIKCYSDIKATIRDLEEKKQNLICYHIWIEQKKNMLINNND